MASRNVASAMSERNPNASGRATSAGKAGTSSCVSMIGGRSRSPWCLATAISAMAAAIAVAPSATLGNASLPIAITTASYRTGCHCSTSLSSFDGSPEGLFGSALQV